METAKTPAGSGDQKLHFLDYWRVIRIRKTVILAVFLLVVLTTTAVTFILPESYRSTVRIEVGKDTTDIAPLLMGTQSQMAYDPFFIQTEFEKIKSKSVLYRVIDELSLGEKWARRDGYDKPYTQNEAFQLLTSKMDVTQFRNTSLIEIRVFSPDPEEAAQIANRIAEVYQDSRLSKSKRASDKSINILSNELAKAETDLREATRMADEMRMEMGVAEIDVGNGLISTVEPEIVRAFERRKAEVKMELSTYTTLLAGLTNTPIEKLADSIPTSTSLNDPRLVELLTRRDVAAQEREALQQEYGVEHPNWIRANRVAQTIDQQIQSRVASILAGLQIEVDRRNQSLQELDQQIKDARDRDSQAMQRYRPYLAAKRNVDTQQRIYEAINLRVLQETVDSKLPKSSIVEITDLAEPSKRPVRPNIPLNIALGVIVGMIMGVGLAFFIEYLDTSVKTIDDVERALQAPVLGVIPQNVGTLLQEGPESPHAEAYRVLRTNLLFSRKNPGANSLTVVSGGAGEGKSTTIFNLATIFAQNGQRVLVVDSDLRRPSLHKLLNVSNSLGLTNLLLKQNTLEEVVQTTSLPNLFFLASGKLPSSSLGILNSIQMKEFIQTVKEKFDFVFFDSPPIMGVSDASVLASSVDMAILVIQYRKYPQAMTIRAKQMVEKVGGTLLGVVLNNINISQDSYYYYYSGYYYDYYSKHDDDEGASKKNGSSRGKTSERADVDLKKKY